MANVDEDPLDSIEKHLWTAKEFLKRKFGKKQDEYIAASDSQLDTKLEYFKSLRETSSEMMAALRAYHNIMYDLSQKERDLSALLRSRTKLTKCDELQASMASVGKALRDSSQDRLEMRKHFSRLADEVTTFRKCAVTDCEESVHKMEVQRTQYRGALSWMRDVSNSLNPDSTVTMYKYRRVQDRVKETKKAFDIEKITSLEKIDLLAISRQGMFSQTLGGYITAIKHYHKHMAGLYGELEREVKVPTTIKFETLKELNDLMPEPSSVATSAEALAAVPVAADDLISVGATETSLFSSLNQEKCRIVDDNKAALHASVVCMQDTLIDTAVAEPSLLLLDDSGYEGATFAQKSNAFDSTCVMSADLASLATDELLIGDDDLNDDIYTGLNALEVEALKEVFALSSPPPIKPLFNSTENKSATGASSTLSSLNPFHRFKTPRLEEAQRSGQEENATIGRSVESCSNVAAARGNTFLSFMPSLIQEAAAAAANVSSSKNSTVGKNAPISSRLPRDNNNKGRKNIQGAASAPNKNEVNACIATESAFNGSDAAGSDAKAGGENSWFKLLEQINLFEDEAECLLPQDGRRTSLGTNNQSGTPNTSSSDEPSLSSTPNRQPADELVGSARKMNSKSAQELPTVGANSMPHWLADDSAA